MAEFLVSMAGEFEVVPADNPMHAARLALAAYGLNQITAGARPPLPLPDLAIVVVGEGHEWEFRPNPKKQLGLDVVRTEAL